MSTFISQYGLNVYWTHIPVVEVFLLILLFCQVKVRIRLHILKPPDLPIIVPVHPFLELLGESGPEFLDATAKEICDLLRFALSLDDEIDASPVVAGDLVFRIRIKLPASIFIEMFPVAADILPGIAGESLPVLPPVFSVMGDDPVPVRGVPLPVTFPLSIDVLHVALPLALSDLGSVMFVVILAIRLDILLVREVIPPAILAITRSAPDIEAIFLGDIFVVFGDWTVLAARGAFLLLSSHPIHPIIRLIYCQLVCHFS